MLIAYIPIVFIILGILLMASKNQKVYEAGRIMYACGMLVTAYTLSTTVMRLGK